MSFHFYVFICSIATSHAKIEWNTSMGACAQARLVHSIFIPCVPPYRTHSQSGRRPSGRYRSPTDICLRAFCLYSKRQFLRKKYKNIRFCYVKSLYFRYTSKIKKFRTKNPDFGTFLYGICCFGPFYTKLSIYRNFPAQYSSYYNVITITLHDFGRVSL